MTKPKPCPCCGRDDTFFEAHRKYRGMAKVGCRCGMSGPYKFTDDEACKNWNSLSFRQWHPIEKCPYDELVLFLTNDGHVVQDFWYDYPLDDLPYTHWMPLPEPTDEMMAKGQGLGPNPRSQTATHLIYRTMISAAPNGGKVSESVARQALDAMYCIKHETRTPEEVLDHVLDLLGLEVEE